MLWTVGLISACSGLAGLWWMADKLSSPLNELSGVLGVGFGALGVIVGAAALVVSWLGYQADRREHAGEMPIGRVTDALALAVRQQWEAEAQLRRLNDPYPLPVSWRPADENVVEPWRMLLQIANRYAAQHQWAAHPEDLVGTDTEITDILTRRAPGRRLLVLGEPGAGKTMLLVILLLGLLDRRRPSDPVPVIFPLASWNPRESLEAWMVNRLTADYPALSHHPTESGARSAAQALLDNRLVLPILDGLDELAPPNRRTALAAINAALPPSRPVVLSSRTEEYRQTLHPDTGVPQRLNGAAGIVLEPLTLDTVATYLRRDAGGEGTPAADRWNPVLDQMTRRSPLTRVLATPLTLFLARTIYNPRPDEAGPRLPNPAELCDTGRFPTETALRTHLLNAFIPAAYRPLSHRPSSWTSARAQHVLRRIARHLERRRHEAVDIAWWELQHALPAGVLTAATGFVVGLFTLTLSAAGRAIWFLCDFHRPRDRGLLSDICFHWLVGFYSFPEETLSVLPLSPMGYAYPAEDWWLLFVDQPSAAILITLGFIVGLVTRLGSRFSPARRVRWSLKSHTLVLSLFCSLTTGVLVASNSGLRTGFPWAIIALPICIIVTGLQALPDHASNAASPITLLGEDRRSFAQFLFLPVLAWSLLLGPAIALGTTAVNAPQLLGGLGVIVASGQGFWVGCVLGLALALNRTASGRFLLIRFYLVLRWRLPWNVMAFLDDAHRRRGVLRQVGSVYQFRHVDLQRHLVALDVPQPPSPTAGLPPPSADPSA
ncbi:NACHT domain-containing protein [Streptomyces umbrinus]|uniref:NACHT domain-containing protein n=1 Tax=Streptomyces umbrinus TaxID=67370 RepID=UPI0033C21E66